MLRVLEQRPDILSCAKEYQAEGGQCEKRLSFGESPWLPIPQGLRPPASVEQGRIRLTKQNGTVMRVQAQLHVSPCKFHHQGCWLIPTGLTRNSGGLIPRWHMRFRGHGDGGRLNNF